MEEEEERMRDVDDWLEPLPIYASKAKQEEVEVKQENEFEGPIGGTCVQTLRNEAGNVVYCLQWDPLSATVICGTRRQAIQQWDLNTGQLVKTFMGHTKDVQCLQFDEHKIVSGGGDHTIKVWDLRSGDCQMTLPGHTSSVLAVQFDDQNKLVSGSYDKTIKAWDMRMEKQLFTLEGHSLGVFSVKFNQAKVISGSADKTVKIWDFSRRLR